MMWWVGVGVGGGGEGDACAVGGPSVPTRRPVPHAGMYGDYVSWLADGKSAKVMKTHELVDADCRCASLTLTLTLPNPTRAAPRRPRAAAPPPPPLPAARLGAARGPAPARGDDETTKMLPRRVRTSRAEDIHLHVSLLPSARRQAATRTPAPRTSPRASVASCVRAHPHPPPPPPPPTPTPRVQEEDAPPDPGLPRQGVQGA